MEKQKTMSIEEKLNLAYNNLQNMPCPGAFSEQYSEVKQVIRDTATVITGLQKKIQELQGSGSESEEIDLDVTK